jgi:hypothetical protein
MVLFLIFLFLFLASFILMLIGLIKPSRVLFGAKNPNRKKIWFIYGTTEVLLVVGIFIVAVVTAKSDEKIFYGSVTYQVSCEGTNQEGVAIFKTFSPERITVYWDKDKFKMVENGGLNYTVVSDLNTNKHFLVNDSLKICYKISCVNLDQQFDSTPDLKKILPYSYKPELEVTSETETICGHKCTKYRILKSGFMRSQAEGWVWLTQEIKLPPSRFDYQNDKQRVLSPLPLQFGFEGTALKLTINEEGVIVTYLVSKIEEMKTDENWFTLPQTYEVR